MRKIYELKDISDGPFFYKDQLIICDKENDCLFFNVNDYSFVNKINIGWSYPLEVLNGQIFLNDNGNNDLFVYDNEIKNFVIYQNSIGGGSVAIFDDKIIEDKYDRKSKSVQVTLYEKSSNNQLWQNTFPDRVGSSIWGKNLYIT
ncbi:MAG: hypothetical protein K2L23_04210, partial [Odoribacter sp.]|nr:hypothetical protein [Odoribacter sp.]